MRPRAAPATAPPPPPPRRETHPPPPQPRPPQPPPPKRTPPPRPPQPPPPKRIPPPWPPQPPPPMRMPPPCPRNCTWSIGALPARVDAEVTGIGMASTDVVEAAARAPTKAPAIRVLPNRELNILTSRL